ncbi:hypothetical protein ACP4OV_019945 [Aristida adscensionis]
MPPPEGGVHHALFIDTRCLAVDADAFPTIDANCVYFSPGGRYIYKCELGIEEGEEVLEMVSEGIGCTERAWDYFKMCPFTKLQLVSKYTMGIPRQHVLWYERV